MFKNCEFVTDQVGGIGLLSLILKFFKGSHNIADKLLPEPNGHQQEIINLGEGIDDLPS